MFVEQAAAQFVLFTGRQAPIDVLREAALCGMGQAPAPVEDTAARPRAVSRPRRRTGHSTRSPRARAVGRTRRRAGRRRGRRD
jgi:hypothetical protein